MSSAIFFYDYLRNSYNKESADIFCFFISSSSCFLKSDIIFSSSVSLDFLALSYYSISIFFLRRALYF